YPGRATTALCPITTFDGVPLYQPGAEPDARAIETRRRMYFEPYHAALSAELERLRARHPRVVLYDCHSIRSRVPRLFEGELPPFNLGTNSGASCAPTLAEAVEAVCRAGPGSCSVNGRFKGGYITRHHGRPDAGVHALQMELACRGYLAEPEHFTPETWPPAYEAAQAAPLQSQLRLVLQACLDFALRT
ncbi:MAG TPA: N-formylglutamate amidohydrolase, partial [Steroidobacteraceae bacterium]|nr:N-formylglutamate amidohydrolase [Steroidobacteraceae bacterium]